jgi:hypothetical protein
MPLDPPDLPGDPTPAEGSDGDVPTSAPGTEDGSSQPTGSRCGSGLTLAHRTRRAHARTACVAPGHGSSGHRRHHQRRRASRRS